MISVIKYFVLILLTFSLSTSCTYIKDIIRGDDLTDEEVVAKAISRPEKQFENYKYDPGLNFSERIKKPPEFVMNYLRELDQKDYTYYIPSAKEKNTVEQSMKYLPPLLRKMLLERVVEVYFINDFMGSGMTDWIVDRNKEIYCFMIFNPVTLKMDMSQWLSWKERTCFIIDSDDIEVKIDAGKKYSAFLGILLHESVHVADYIMHITPYVEDATRTLSVVKGEKISLTPFVVDMWKELYAPYEKYDFDSRKDISFYGLGGGPKIKISAVPELYKNLARTPFASIYGSMSWAEDLAEFLLFYHLTQKLKQPYSITLLHKGVAVYSLDPMKSKIVRERFPRMDVFYK